MTRDDNAGQSALSTGLDLIWGCEGIAAAIGRPASQVYRMLEANELPARKTGGKWVASRAKLKAFFEGEAA